MSERYKVITFEVRVLLDEDPGDAVVMAMQRKVGDWLERIPGAEAGLLLCNAPMRKRAKCRPKLLQVTGHVPCDTAAVEPSLRRLAHELVEFGENGMLRYGEWAAPLTAHHHTG